jgi:hypothetical protein
MPNGQGGKKQVNKTRFWASFHRLQELGKRESGAYRVAWTQEDQEARQTSVGVMLMGFMLIGLLTTFANESA